MNNPVVLVLPDIHGRDFYKDALKEAVDSGIDIVCLGDYLDPYPYEALHGGNQVAKKLFLKQSLPSWRAVVSRMLFLRQYRWVATLILLHI